MGFENVKIGYGFTGSFCTLDKSFAAMERLVSLGADVTPIMSDAVYTTSTRFGEAEHFIKRAEEICNRAVMHKVTQTELIGPKNLLDIMIIAPCTSNTIGKLANGINDTPVTMAAKATIRNARPVLIAVSTNDGLWASAKNIGILMNYKNYFLVPFEQDDPIKKPGSLVAKFDLIEESAEAALCGRQLQPVLR